jgi:hypothetical protein
LPMQPRSAAEARLLTQSGIFGSWLNRKCEASSCQQGNCASFEGDSTELDSLPPPSWSTLGTPRAKGLGQTETQIKRKNT